MMNTHVAKLIAFNVLLNITDLLAPRARTQVINIVIPNAIKSGGRPVHKNKKNKNIWEKKELDKGHKDIETKTVVFE